MADAADGNGDCDVIFENSPLYWSMVDAGLGDIAEQDVHKVKPISSSETGFKPTNCGKLLWCRVWECGSQLFKSLFSLKNENRVQTQKVYKQAFVALAQSSLLSHEDDLFLQDLATEQESDKTCTALPAYSRKWLAVTCFMIPFLLLCNFSPWRPVSLELWGQFLANTLLVLLLPIFLSQALQDWRERRERRKERLLLASVERGLRVASRWSDVAAKCVRFIQESELVARGFTFVGKPGSNRVVKELQPAATLHQRQCPLLRKALFLASRSVFFACRRSFACLLHMCPVSLEVSGVTHYCSEIPLSQYPTMLQQDHSGQQEEVIMAALYDMTDGFSIDVLKSLQELNHIHLSEFLRRLAVCFVSNEKETDLCISVISLLEVMSHELDRLHTELQSCLTAHRRGSVTSTSKSRRTAVWQSASSASQVRLTYSAIHSLELHLLAALKKIQDLSEAVEKKLEEDQNQNATEDIEDPVRQNWSQMLTMVTSDLGACTGCLEEGVKQLEKKDVPESKVPAMERTPAVPDPTPSVNIIKVSAQDNPIILDEVFEAYSEPQDFDSRRGHCELTASEEEAWQKNQKSNLKLCLNELQSIIDVRAVQRQERERIAVDRMKYTTHTAETGPADSNTHHDLQNKKAASESTQVDDSEQTDQEESKDDLARDVAERVDFWKQFDQTASREMVNSDTKKQFVQGFDSSQVANAGGENVHTTRQEKDYGEEENGDEELGRWQENENCQVDEAISASSSPDSDFVFVDDQSVDTDSMVLSLASQVTEERESLPSLNAMQNTLLSSASLTAENSSDHPSQYDIVLGISTLEQHDHDLCGNNDEIVSNREEDNTNSSRNEEKSPSFSQNPPESTSSAEPATLEKKKEGSRGGERGERERTCPEGVEEHLSLPAAPSPLAFSIASMVASRARSFAQVEEKFGDSSSEEEEDDGGGEEVW